ncbi:MAG: carbohydrate binding domain-containing protein [Chloroflexi bacterium]|nr:carbohydrate binding domain-containing protein [Chloroflexota bacterium]
MPSKLFAGPIVASLISATFMVFLIGFGPFGAEAIAPTTDGPTASGPSSGPPTMLGYTATTTPTLVSAWLSKQPDANSDHVSIFDYGDPVYAFVRVGDVPTDTYWGLVAQISGTWGATVPLEQRAGGTETRMFGFGEFIPGDGPAGNAFSLSVSLNGGFNGPQRITVPFTYGSWPNLAPNPSFENGTDSPTGWRTLSPVGSVQGWESSSWVSGHRSLSVSGPTPSNYNVRWVTTDLVSVMPGQTYTFSTWIRADSFITSTGRLNVTLFFYDADGNSLSQGWGPDTRDGAGFFWQKFAFNSPITFPPGVAKVQISLGYNSTDPADTNKVYFDNVALIGPSLYHRLYLPAMSKD